MLTTTTTPLAEILATTNAEARPYQERVINLVRDNFINVGVRSQLVNSPTGSGKTVMGLCAARCLQDELGIGVGWCAMRRNLLNQVVIANSDGPLPINLNMGVKDLTPISMFDKNPPSHDAAGRPIKLLVVDEAQHDAASSMGHLHNTIKPDYVLGLSATPYRTDKLKLCFEKVIIDAGIHQLIQQGYLSKYHQYTIPHWNPETVVKHYLAEPEKWGKSVMYWLNIGQATECLNKLTAAGVRAELIIGTQPHSVRENLLNRFDNTTYGDGDPDGIDVIVNMFILTEGWDCLDEKTEVLTEQGWMYYDKFTAFHQGKMMGDNTPARVWSLNRETDKMELVDVNAVEIRNLRAGERMVEIKSQHLDILVTEGHEFHLKYRDPAKNGHLSDNYITRTAGHLVNRRSSFGLPLAASADFKEISLSDDELRLIAWSLTDSSWDSSYLTLHQSEKPTKHSQRIRELLDRLNLDYTEQYIVPEKCGFETDYGMIRFLIPKGTSKAQPRNGWVRWEQYFDTTDKRIPLSLQSMSSRQFMVFYNEMILANGERKSNNHSGWLWTSRKHQADVINRMAITRGFASNIGTKITKHETEVYRVTVRNRSWMVIDPSDDRSESIEFVPYSGSVWCLKNKNSTIVIRRNGKTAIVGNCTTLKTAFVRDSQRGPTIQMAGRAFRKHPDCEYKQIVQSQDTHWPMQRTAQPNESFIWMTDAAAGESWRSVKPSQITQQVANRAILTLAHTQTSMPDFITKKRAKQFDRNTGESGLPRRPNTGDDMGDGGAFIH